MQQQLSHIGDKSHFFAVILFLIWPLLAVISAFRNYDKNWSKNIFWAFCAFYGFVFAIGAESESSDIVRYVAEYQMLHNNQLTLDSAIDYYKNSGEVDIVRTLIAVVLSRFSDNQSLLTLVYGIIFGFFFSRNLWYVMERMEGKWLPITILLFVCFFLVNPIWRINGFRMWTAAHIFLYGLLPLLFEGKKKGLVISASAILVHFSFIVPMGVLMAYLAVGNRLTLFFGFFVLTIFVSEINIEVFNNLVESYAPEIIQERSSGYRDAAQVEMYREGDPEQSRNWYAVWYGRALGWAVIGYMGILFFRGREFFEKNRGWMNLYCFTLLFYGVANLFSSLPSGGRFISIATFSSLALIILYIQNRPGEKVTKRFTMISVPALLLYIIVSIRIGFYSISATSVIGNPVMAFFTMGENLSLNDVLRLIL